MEKTKFYNFEYSSNYVHQTLKIRLFCLLGESLFINFAHYFTDEVIGI